MGADCVVSDGPKMRSIMPPWWRWVVLAATVYMSLVVNGYAYCFGLLKIQLQEEYKNVSPWAIAIVGGLVPSLYLLLAPFGIAINEFFGSRLVTIVGSVMSAVCFILVWLNGIVFHGGFFVDLVFLGIGQGVSFALLYGPCVAILPSYFGSDQLSLATGITNAGASAGVIIYGVISYPLFGLYGWRGCMLFYSLLSLHGVLAGLAFTKMIPEKPTPVVTLKVDADIEMTGKGEQDPTTEALLIPTASADEPVQPAPTKRTFLTVLKKYFDGRLICQGPFVLMLFSAAFSITGYFVPTLLAPAQARKPENGVDPMLQKNIMVLFGVCNLIGRIVFGRLGDYSHKSVFLTSFTMYVGGLVISAAAALIFPHTMHLGNVSFIVFMVIYGFSASPIITMRSLLTINLFGKKNANASFGWFLCAQGSLQMAGYILPSWFDTMAPVFAYLFAAGMFLASATCCACTAKLFFSERRKMIAARNAAKARGEEADHH